MIRGLHRTLISRGWLGLRERGALINSLEGLRLSIGSENTEHIPRLSSLHSASVGFGFGSHYLEAASFRCTV